MTRYTKGRARAIHWTISLTMKSTFSVSPPMEKLQPSGISAAGRKLVQGLLQNAGLHGGVVAVQRVGRDGDVLGLVLAGNGIRCGAGGPAGDIVQGAGTIGHCAVCRHFGGLKGNAPSCFLGDGVRLSVIWTSMVVPFDRDGGLGGGGGGELCRDLLVHLRNGQAVGAHLVAVHPSG